jgi:hypothetical protein
MAGSKTHLIQNAREMIVSTDLTRIGQLAAREQQNADMARAMRADFYNPVTGTVDDFGGTNRGSAYEVIPSALVAPSLDPVGGSWNMTIGAGEVEGPQSGVASPDVSSYGVARWAQQVVTWPGAPSNVNPSIATIYVVPTDIQADQASRNILLDPVARTFEPQNVYKTSNPSGTIGVVVGTPAATPLPPLAVALPTNAIPLFDVYMPTTSTDSTSFLVTRRCWRRVEFSGASQHGIAKGCVPTWAYAAEATGAPPLLYTCVPASPSTLVVNQPVIDGELLTFALANAAITFAPDTNNSPGATAPAGNDMPTYLYLCGGRHWPWSHGVPVQGVESLTPPDVMGYPSAALAIAAGGGSSTIPRNAALFIGVAFRVAGSTRSKSLFYEGDWVRPQSYVSDATCSICGFYAAPITVSGTAATVTLALPGIPATTTALEIQADELPGGATPTNPYVVRSCVGGPMVIVFNATTGITVQQSARVKIALPANAGSPAHPSLEYIVPQSGGGSFNIRATAYNMNVPRLSK